MFFGSFFGNNFALENLQPLAEPSKGWLVSIVVIVSVAPWAYVGFENIDKQQKSLTLHQTRHLSLSCTVY